MSKRKFEISFDEERMIKDGKYNPDDAYYSLDQVMKKTGITKTGKGIYEGDNQHAFGSLYFSLLGCMWFMKYVNKWLSYHDGVSDDVIKSLNLKERQATNEFG